MSVRRFLAAGAVSLAVAACGGAAPTNAGGQPAGGAGSSLPPSGAPAAATSGGSDAGPVTGHLGDKLTFKNFALDPVDATLVKIYDPATPKDASEAPLPQSTHWVGVEVIVNDQVDYQTDGGGLDAVTSAGNTVTTTDNYQGGSYVLGNGFAGCTQTNGNPQDVNPYTYCAAFPVPDGQTLVKVGINVTGAPLVKTDQATWTVP
jgi:hypothetical protein